MLVQCEGLTQRVILGRQPAIISLSSCNSRPCTIARAEIVNAEATFFQSELHDPISDNVNVVSDYANNDSIAIHDSPQLV